MSDKKLRNRNFFFAEWKYLCYIVENLGIIGCELIQNVINTLDPVENEGLVQDKIFVRQAKKSSGKDCLHNLKCLLDWAKKNEVLTDDEIKEKEQELQDLENRAIEKLGLYKLSAEAVENTNELDYMTPEHESKADFYNIGTCKRTLLN